MKLEELKVAATNAVEQQQLDTARPLWSQLCELEPLELDNWLILAAIDESLGFLPAALGHLKYAFHLDSQDPDVWLKSAQIKWKTRNFNGALNDITMALCLDFTDIEVRLLFASWLRQLQNFKFAFEQLRYVLRSGNGPEEVLLDAAACAYLFEHPVEQDRWFSNAVANLTGYNTQSLATAVAARVGKWVDPEKWPHLNSVSKEHQPIFLKTEEMLSLQREHFNWPHYYENRAHTEEQTLQPVEQETITGLAKQVIDYAGSRTNEISPVLEFGCGTGLLGQRLKTSRPDILLTGVAYSDAALKVANGKNHYDTLLHRSMLPEINQELLTGLSCIVLENRVSHYEYREALLAQLLRFADAHTVIIVMFEPGSDDRREIIDQLDENGKSHTWLKLQKKAKEKDALIIGGGATSKVQKHLDKLEQAGNALIKATTSLQNMRVDQCEPACQTALELKPRASQALFSLGLCAQDGGDHKKALRYYRQARMRYSGHANNWFQIASVHQHNGNFTAMINCYAKCLSFAPAHTAALQNLISLHFSQQNMDATWHYARQLLLHNALNPDIIEKVENTVKQSKNPELKKWHEDFIHSAEWLKTRFNAALQSKYFPRAEKLLVELEAKETTHETGFLRAQLQEKSGQLTRAKQTLEQLLKNDPGKDNCLHSMASICADQGLIREACQAWASARDISSIENQNLQNFLFFANYCYFMSDERVSAHHFNWGKALSRSISENIKPVVPPTRRAEGKIRIGYVSADFRMHSVSMFLYNILKHHDAEKFTIYCYSMTPTEDPMTIKLRYFSDYWRNITSMNNEQLDGCIRRDKIDILVDLAGHTSGNRLPVFTLRPAPIQCTYLGYPNTTGLAEMDYRLTDNEADPEGMTEHLHSEELIRLPNGFLSYSRHLSSTPVTLYREQSENRHYTFACCNNIFKVNERVVDVFSKILKRMPSASLLLKAHNLNNPEIISHYHSLFAAHGIGEQQLHLMNTIDVDEHQNLYNSIDIALDPFPYNGTTTSCDALWMGVPVLVLAGSRHAGRVGVSIMNRIGLSNWVADDEEDYINKAIAFASDKAYLLNLKRSMRQRLLASPLMQPGTVVKDIENAYIQMHQKYWKP